MMREFDVLKDISPEISKGETVTLDEDGDIEITKDRQWIDENDIEAYVKAGFIRERKVDRYYVLRVDRRCDTLGYRFIADGGVERLTKDGLTSLGVCLFSLQNYKECDKARWDEEVAKTQKPKIIKCKVEKDKHGYCVTVGNELVYLFLNTLGSTDLAARFIGAVYAEGGPLQNMWPMWKTPNDSVVAVASQDHQSSGDFQRVWPIELWFTS